MKKLLTTLLLCTVMLLSGCTPQSNQESSSKVDSEASSTISSETSPTTTETSQTVIEGITSDSDNILTDYESLIYNGTSKVRISDLCEFEVPVDIAKQCISIEDAMKKMEELNGTLELDDITPEFWTSLFKNSGYFVNYHEAAMLMSEELLLQINLFKADSGTPSMINVLSDTNDVSTFNSIFGKLVVTSLYGAKGFSILSKSGIVNTNDVTLLSFIYACETSDFSLTDGYFGYFIVGYSEKSQTLMTCLISGLSGISDPEMINTVYESFNSPKEDTEYWGILERSTNE